MEHYIKKTFPGSWLAGAWVLALILLVNVSYHYSGQAAPLPDPQKKARVAQMYANYKKEFPEVKDITPAELMRLLAENKKVVLVDVRSPEEQRVSMLPGAIPREAFLRDIDNYRDHVIVGYCTISYRSGKLAQELRPQGINMLNLQGGLLAWLHAGGKVWAQRDETRKVHVYGKKWDLAPARYQTVWRRLTFW